MALIQSEQDKAFISNLKNQGVGMDDAFARLQAVHAHMQQQATPDTSISSWQQQQNEYGGQMDRIVGNIGNFAQGSPAGLYSGTANGLGAGMNAVQQNILNPAANFMRNLTGQKSKNIPLAGDMMKKAGQDISNEIAPSNDPATNAGKSFGNFISQIPGIVAGEEVAGGINAGAAQGLAKEAVPAASKVAAVAAGSVPMTEAAVSAQTGKLANPTDLSLGVLTNLLFHGAGELAGKMSDSTYRAGTEIKSSFGSERSEELVQKAKDLGLYGGAKNLKTKAQAIIADRGTQISDIVGRQGGVPVTTRDALIKGVTKTAADLKDIGLSSSADNIQKWIDEFTSGKNELTAQDLMKIKQKAQGEVLPQLNNRGELSNALTDQQAAQKTVWTDIYKNASKELDQLDPRIPALNKDQEAAYHVMEPAEKRLNKVPGPSSTAGANFKKIISNPAFTTYLSKALDKAGWVAKNPFVQQVAQGALAKVESIGEK